MSTIKNILKIQDKEQDKEEKIKQKRKIRLKSNENLNNLWKLYPRKIGKKKAFDSYKKARKLKKIPYETIENGLYRYISILRTARNRRTIYNAWVYLV